MATPLKFAALISLPKTFEEKLEVGKKYQIFKPETIFTAFNIPMEISTCDHIYLGKVKVVELRVTTEGTYIAFEVLTLFSDEVSKVYTDNWI